MRGEQGNHQGSVDCQAREERLSGSAVCSVSFIEHAVARRHLHYRHGTVVSAPWISTNYFGILVIHRGSRYGRGVSTRQSLQSALSEADQTSASASTMSARDTAALPERRLGLTPAP